MKTKNLPPYAPTLIESTRAIGYSLETAIADIIDNSIAAQAENINISFWSEKNSSYLTILDDGSGMSEEELDTAMQYGSKNPNDTRNSDDLGRFGLGLKIASLSQCRCLTVVSKQDRKVKARRWDLDHVADKGEWSLIMLGKKEIEELPEIKELTKYKSGTLVIWQNLDKLKIGETNFDQSFGMKMDKEKIL